MVSCPLCRTANYQTIDRPRYNSNNNLDKLEDFWDNIDLLIPNSCYWGLGLSKHYLGMNKQCGFCLKYRKYGPENNYIVYDSITDYNESDRDNYERDSDQDNYERDYDSDSDDESDNQNNFIDRFLYNMPIEYDSDSECE
jgi:hypothetical protein